MAAFPAPSDYRVVDDMVLEYFVHRGFTRSFRALATDQQHDRTRSFDVGRVVDALLGCARLVARARARATRLPRAHSRATRRRYVQRHDAQGLRETWRFLDARFFTHVGAEHARVVGQLEGALYRHFLVYAVQVSARGASPPSLVCGDTPPRCRNVRATAARQVG